VFSVKQYQMKTSTILYATAKLEGPPARERPSRRMQSAAAQNLLCTLGSGFASVVHSKSHSYAMVAAAAGDAPELLLGIDIEWRKPNRPFAELAGFFADIGAEKLGMAEFYRLWTFGEAYFKAFQRLPTSSQLQEVRSFDRGAQDMRLSDGTCLFQCLIEGDYALSLVWRSKGGQPCSLRNISPL
jgi:hypothetical protein